MQPIEPSPKVRLHGSAHALDGAIVDQIDDDGSHNKIECADYPRNWDAKYHWECQEQSFVTGIFFPYSSREWDAAGSIKWLVAPLFFPPGSTAAFVVPPKYGYKEGRESSEPAEAARKATVFHSNWKFIDATIHILLLHAEFHFCGRSWVASYAAP